MRADVRPHVAACASAPAHPPLRAEAGLSLLELLVAIALLGMLVLLLRDGFTLGHRVWERAGAQVSAAIEPVEAVQGLLRDRFTTLNPAWLAEGASSRVLFEGEAGRVTFFARPPDALGSGTYFRFVLAATPEGVLELAWHPDTDRRLLPAWQRAPLLDGVAQFSIAYFGPTATDQVPRWRDSWRGQPRPPERVRVSLSFGPSDRRVWPDLVVAPRAVVDSTCIFQPQARRCAGRT